MQPLLEVSDVLRAHWTEVERSKTINSWQLRTLGALMRCRTAAMGGHIDACTSCGTLVMSYNSCRNRHCPKCQGNKREQWIAARTAELLPVPYLHVVFTLPSELNTRAQYSPKAVYDSLFAAAWHTMQQFGNDSKHLGAAVGMIAILHTWGQTLQLHPHIHCIVPSGGLTQTSTWKWGKTKGKFLFPVKAMSPVFKARYLKELSQRSKHKIPKNELDTLFNKKWVVYAKCAFGDASQVVEYLGRYTHKVAISNHRLMAHDGKTVQFKYKNYHTNQIRETELEAMEFIRRFSLHILPRGYVRIRHYGILSSTGKGKALPQIRSYLQAVAPPTAAPKTDPRQLTPRICPCCKTATMITIAVFGKRGPPTTTSQSLTQLRKG